MNIELWTLFYDIHIEFMIYILKETFIQRLGTSEFTVLINGGFPYNLCNIDNRNYKSYFPGVQADPASP